jgi:hypothetical protein
MYALVDSTNTVVNLVEWDGKTPWSPPSGQTAVAVPAGKAVSHAWTYTNGAFVAPSAQAIPPGRAVPLPRRAAAALSGTNDALLRIVEAVALGTGTWTSPDAVALVNHRRALRAIAEGVDTVSTVLPSMPAAAVGT